MRGKKMKLFGFYRFISSNRTLKLARDSSSAPFALIYPAFRTKKMPTNTGNITTGPTKAYVKIRSNLSPLSFHALGMCSCRMQANTRST